MQEEVVMEMTTKMVLSGDFGLNAFWGRADLKTATRLVQQEALL